MKSISLSCLCIATAVLIASLSASSPPPRWYKESLIHSHHSTGDPAPEWKIQFATVRPDAVQFHGGAYAAGKVLSQEHGFAMVCTLNRSGQWSDVMNVIKTLPEEEEKLFFKRVNPDGSSAGRYHLEHFCYHSPGIDKHILPVYRDVIERVGPDQIWIDHTVVTVNLCYCDNCRETFRKRHGIAPPESPGDSRWEEWVTYHREGFESWMEKVHALDPVDTLITFNHAYFIAQPEPPPSYVRNLSADIHSNPMDLCLFGRYASTVGLPFDLMPGLTNKWAGTVAKPKEEVLQAAAVITANGGRWNIGEFPMSADRQPAAEMLELAKAGAEFVRARQSWTQQTEAVPLVAVLQTASTQYRRVIPRGEEDTPKRNNPAGTRIYWHNNHPIPREIAGAGAGLLENNIPFDIINEAVLKKRLGDYKVLIVADQFYLDAETVTAIRQFVKNGGGLLATGRTIESDLAELLGVQLASGAVPGRATMELNGAKVAVEAPLRVRATGAHVMQSFGGGADSPAITRRTHGGRVLYIAADIFRTYLKESPFTSGTKPRSINGSYRAAMMGWIDTVSPALGYACSAPPWIEVGLRGKNGDLLVQLVERTFEWGTDPDLETPVELNLALKTQPATVRLQPGDREIQWNWRLGEFHAVVPLNQVQVHSIVEIEGAAPWTGRGTNGINRKMIKAGDGNEASPTF